jgi:putative peptidoglycan lipid II flippase
MSQKFTSTIAGASIFISLLGLFSRGLGFVREMIFANNFGLETEFDLYLVGAVLPITINNILLFIGQNYFVSGFQRINSSDTLAAQKYYKQSFIIFVGIGILIAILLFLTSDFIINSYMHSASRANKDTAVQIFRIFLLTIPFSAGVSIFSAFLQTVYEFKHPAISVLFLNISIIVLLLLLTDSFGILIIPIGYAIGTLLQFTYLFVKSKKFMRLNLLTSTNENILSMSLFSSTLFIIILIESISQLYSIFDRYFYGEISTGGIASLNYGLIVWFLPVSIFSISLATVVFPIISKTINDSSNDEIEKIYNESISMNTFIFIPLAFILFFYGDIIIRIFFERGKFDQESTAMTFGVLKFYSISLVFYSVYTVFNKIFYSINQVKLLLLITISGLLIKLVFNFLLIDLQQDGLALSSSLSYIFFFFVSYLILNVKLNIRNRVLFIKDFMANSVNCFVSFVCVKYISDIIYINNIIQQLLIMILFICFYLFNSILIQQNSMTIVRRVFENLNLINKIKPV